MRFFYALLVVVGWLGCTQPQVPGPSDRDSGAPRESTTARQGAEEQTEVRDAGTAGAQTRADMDPEDAPEEILDAGSEGEAGRPKGPAMTEDPPSEPAMEPNAVGDAMPTLLGIWYGPAEDLLGRRYQACTTIEQVTAPGPAGSVKATGALECEWDLEYTAFSDGEFAFDAIVKSGPGCFPSELRLPMPTSDTVRFNIYIDDGPTPDGVGTLVRVEACP
jgi:hypothetical protein